MSQPPNNLDYAGPLRPRDPEPPYVIEPDAGTATLAVLRFIGWRLLAAGVIAVVIGALWFAVSPFLAIVSPIAVFVFFPELAGMSTRVRRQRAAVILAYLEQAARLNLPLPRMLDAAQLSEERDTAKRLRRVRDLLEEGAPLDAALRLGAPEVSARAVTLIAAAERIGRLPQTLARLVDEQREPPDDAERGAFVRWYPLVISLIVLIMVTMIMVFVVPRMEQIYRDFGMRLPAVTRWTIEVSRATFAGEVPWLLLLLVVVSIVLVGGAFERIFAAPQRVWTPRASDYGAWYLPVVGGIARDRGMADACRTIASALRSGRGLDRAVAEAAGLRVNAVLQNRLRKWHDGLASGLHAADAARQARLPGLLAGMVGPGRGANLPDAMDFCANYYDGRFSRLRELLRGAVIPVIVLLFGGVVLVVASALYLPLVQMIDGLSGSVGKGFR